MRKWGKIIALLGVLVVLAAAYFLLKGGQPGKSPAEPNGSPAPTATASPDTISFLDMQGSDITKILLKRDTGDIVLEMKEVEVEVLTPQADGTTATTKEKRNVWFSDQFAVDQTVSADIVFGADSLTSKRLIDENPQDPSIYGLDKPLVITFYSKDGKEETLEIGTSTPTKDSYYVRKGGQKAVYTADSYYSEKLTVNKLNLMSKNFYGREDLTVDDMTTLSVTKNGEKFFDSRLVSLPATWQLTYPFEIAGDYPDLNRFFEGLVGLRASQIIAENPTDLKLYGLDKPKYVFDYTLGGKHYSLKVGSMKDSLYYGMFDGINQVFTLSADAVKAADMPLIDVVELLVYVPSIFDIEKLVIEIDGRVDELRMNATKEPEDTDEFFFNGKKMEGDNAQTMFKRYYQGAIAIMGDTIDLKAEPKGETFARFTYTLENATTADKTVVIELIPTPDDYGYYIMKNKKYTGLVMGKRQLDKEDMGIRKAYQNLMDAIK